MVITKENTELEYSRALTAKQTGQGSDYKREEQKNKRQEEKKTREIRQVKWNFK